MVKKIYLVGAMSGKTHEEVYEWRADAKYFLERQFRVIDPADYYCAIGEPTYDTDKEYVRWELRSVKNCDLLVAKVEDGFNSLGTTAEITTAYNNDIPILLLVDSKDQKVHPFIEEMCDKKFTSIEDLWQYAKEYYDKW